MLSNSGIFLGKRGVETVNRKAQKYDGVGAFLGTVVIVSTFCLQSENAQLLASRRC